MNDIIRSINLDDKNTLFYLLNIFHDVIHDYGPGSTGERWFKNQNLIKSFYSDTLTMSIPSETISLIEEYDGGSRTITTTDPTSVYKPQSKILSKSSYKSKFPGMGQRLGTRENYITVVDENRGRGVEDVEMATCSNMSSIETKYFEAKQVSDLFLDAFKNTIIFNTFNFMQQLMIENSSAVFPIFDLSNVKSCAYYAYVIMFFPESNGWDEVNMNYEVQSLGVTITNTNSNIDLDTLKLCIAQELSFYLFVTNKLYARIYNKNTYTSSEFMNILTNFMTDGYIEKCISHVCGLPEEFILFQKEEINVVPLENQTNMEITGGATNLTSQECKGLVDEITTYLNNAKNITENLKNIIQSGDRSKKTMNLYDAQRSEIQNAIKGFLNAKGETKKAGMADNLIKKLGPRFNERLVSKELDNFDNTFNEGISKILHDCEQEIQISIEVEEKKRKKEEEEAGRMAAGEYIDKLNPQDCKVRDQFCALIAKLGLWINNVCDANGNVKQNLPINTNVLGKLQSKMKGTQIFHGHNDFVKTQIDILLYYANWNKQNENSGFGTVKSQSLDDELYDFVSYQYRDKKILGSKVFCSKCNKYGIDNAAKIEKNVYNKIFCPYTSVLDGMVQCSYNSAIGRMEYGNMNFLVGQTKGFYQGKVFVDQENKKRTNDIPIVSYEVILKPYNYNRNIFNVNSPGMLLNGHDLKAYVSLKNTLVSIIKYNEYLTNKATNNPQMSQDILKIQTYMTSSEPEGYKEGIFGNIYRLISGANSFELVDEDMISLVLNILIKGTGDIFQELNAVCKYGGYQEGPKSNKSIQKYDINGDAMRLFVANDRPSASRFCFLLMHGNASQINTKAFGGYTGPNKDKDLLILRSNRGTKICMFCDSAKKGGNKTCRRQPKHDYVKRSKKHMNAKRKHTKKRLYQKTLTNKSI